MDPTDPSNWYLWGYIQSATGDYVSAQNKFWTALKIDGNFTNAEKELKKIDLVLQYDKAFSVLFPMSVVEKNPADEEPKKGWCTIF
jgi:hypothetical protein